ncbi:MAG: hypothetical protein K1Y01_20210 [Vicinamibacteria bacterium]|nr:hypothetical protein [Vicinamibacteria bacterium]
MSPDAPLNSRDVVLLPYLRLVGRLSVGPWEVIPRPELTRADTTTQQVFEVVPKYLDLYAIPKHQPREKWGCLVKKKAVRFGDFVERHELVPVHHAILVGVLASNPEANARNPGRSMSTSESCMMFGHPISEEGRVSVENGAMFHQVVVAGLRLGDDDGYVSHPTSLCAPWDGNQVDEALAAATHTALTLGTEGARRLSTAIEWLQTVWMNTEAVSWDVRVMALKAAWVRAT